MEEVDRSVTIRQPCPDPSSFDPEAGSERHEEHDNERGPTCIGKEARLTPSGNAKSRSPDDKDGEEFREREVEAADMVNRDWPLDMS